VIVDDDPFGTRQLDHDSARCIRYTASVYEAVIASCRPIRTPKPWFNLGTVYGHRRKSRGQHDAYDDGVNVATDRDAPLKFRRWFKRS
jgi:hypothetical protein